MSELRVSRIQRVVERSKTETSLIGANTSTPRPRYSQSQAGIEYTTTRVVNVTKDTLEARRVVATDPGKEGSAQFQVLRTKVLQQMRKSGWSTLGISSSSVGAGKSLVATNLAVSMAVEGNQSVLLVDMDLRKPAIHDYFGFIPNWGVLDILDASATVADALVNPSIERLVILPGRTEVLSSSVTLASPSMRELVEELKCRYANRIVIFDLPPALVSDDVLVFMPYLDCGLCVVDAGASTASEVTRTIEVMSCKPLLGTVLNRADATGGPALGRQEV